MQDMVYDFKTHSLHHEIIYKLEIDICCFSLKIHYLELFFELQNGKFLGACGFLPLISADKCSIELPKYKSGDYFLHNIDLSMIKRGEIYDLKRKIPQTIKYFSDANFKYDRTQGIILLGESPSVEENVLKINKNIVCGLDESMNLKSIYLMPEDFIN
jgi:hypothetical protein